MLRMCDTRGSYYEMAKFKSETGLLQKEVSSNLKLHRSNIQVIYPQEAGVTPTAQLGQALSQALLLPPPLRLLPRLFMNK